MSARSRQKALGKVLVYLLVPLPFFVVPTAWLEKQRPICLFRLALGKPCPGCGMTRALSCVAHGQVKQAWHYNKLVIVVLPLLIYSWGRAILKAGQQAAWQD